MTFIAWPGESIYRLNTTPMIHLVDDTYSLCGYMLHTSFHTTFQFTGNICPLCDRLQDLPRPVAEDTP